MADLQVRIISPSGVLAEAQGKSLHLPLAETKDHRCGGDYNIHPGHVAAVLVLSDGAFRLLDGERIVLSGRLGDGIATVEHDSVTVLSDSAIIYDGGFKE